MTEPIPAQKAPYKVEVEAGRTYVWCACGRSKTQPFCDLSHKGTGIKPLGWKCEESKTVWFCGCKQSGKKPFCDSTHKTL
jgi:CDGSH-type Zn-finger protein